MVSQRVCFSLTKEKLLQRDPGTGIIECVECKKKIKNCRDCVSDQEYQVTCLICQANYYLENRVCSSCSKNCLECVKGDSCQICNNTYFIDQESQKCEPCGIEQCRVCNKTNVSSVAEDTRIDCTVCNDGWGLGLNNTCWECQKGCKVCNYVRNVCTKCDDHFYLFMGSCIQYPENCLKANSLGFCYLCNTSINTSQKGKSDWDESWNENQYNFEELYKEEVEESETAPEEQSVSEETHNNYESLFYMSVNSYCLLCSDYHTGQYLCPDNCLDDTFISIFSIRLDFLGWMLMIIWFV